MAELVVTHAEGVVVWRVGYLPEPWAWVGWEWATDGRFPGRWDDAAGNFRTVYAGASLLACLLEMLADFRPDPLVVVGLAGIVDDDPDGASVPTVAAGTVDRSWLEPRVGACGRLTGWFADITAAGSLAALHPLLVGQALQLGFQDFDAATLKDSRSRPLTQNLASHLYTSTPLSGVKFRSRHGDDMILWAVFERPGDGPITPCISQIKHHALRMDHPDIANAMRMLGLRWR